MSYVHRTLIVQAGKKATAQMICSTLAGEAGEDMFITPLSSDGNNPATHWISAGMIGEEFAGLLTDPNALYAACQQAGLPQTLADCQSLLDTSMVSDGEPFAVMASLGLQIIQGTL